MEVLIQKTHLRNKTVLTYHFSPLKKLVEYEITNYNLLDQKILESSFLPSGLRMFTKIFVNDQKRPREREIHINSDCEVESKVLIKYNANRLKKKVTCFDNNGDVEYKEIMIFGKKGKLRNVFNYTAENILLFKICYKYDRGNKIIEEKHYGFNDVRELTKVFKYNDDGLCEEVNFFGKENEIEKKYIFTYDFLKRGHEIIEQNASCEIESRVVYDYSDEGTLRTETEYDKFDQIKSLNEYVYDYF